MTKTVVHELEATGVATGAATKNALHAAAASRGIALIKTLVVLQERSGALAVAVMDGARTAARHAAKTSLGIAMHKMNALLPAPAGAELIAQQPAPHALKSSLGIAALKASVLV